MRDKYLEEAMVCVLKDLGLEPDTPWRVEPFNANLWISSMYRVIVDTTDKENAKLSLFVKRLPENKHRHHYFESDIYFINETAAYKKILATFSDFQKEEGLKDPIQFAPRCYHAQCDGENDLIILQDMTTEGYSLPSRVEGLNLAELETLMTHLGQFHALSLSMKCKQPDRFGQLSTAVKETIWRDGHFQRVSKIAFTQAGVEAYEMLEKTDSQYAQILQPFATRTGECLQQTSRYDPKNEPWNVITHGDMWISNLLFSSPSNQRMRFIDFQQCRYGSPALDLSSVLYLCMDTTLREEHREELLQLYHRSMSQILLQIGLDPELLFPFRQVEEQLKKYGRYGLGIGFVNIPHAMHVSSEEDPSIGAKVTPGDVVNNERNKMSPACKQRILDIIRDAITRGYLE